MDVVTMTSEIQNPCPSEVPRSHQKFNEEEEGDEEIDVVAETESTTNLGTGKKEVMKSTKFSDLNYELSSEPSK